jgi:ABC-type branched-subunit amino acid transport system ATPase component
MSGPDLLEVQGLCLSFGGISALDNVDLSLAVGEIHGLIGPNGAGKTSLVNCICGFYKPQRGSIRLAGTDLLGVPVRMRAPLGLARTFQHSELFRSMSVLENVQVGAHTRGRPSMFGEALCLLGASRAERAQREAAMDILAMVGLAGHWSWPAGALPLGLQRRLGLARAVSARPKVLLLDEPAAGMNPSEKQEMATLLRALRTQLQLSMLLIEHDMELVMGLCDSVTVLDFGKRIASGPPEIVQRDPAVIAAYLGPDFVLSAGNDRS